MIFFIFLTNLLWIQYFFREFTMDSLSISWIHYYSLPISFIHYEFNWCVANILWIHREYIYFMNSLLIHFLFCEFTIYFTNMSLMCFPYSLISVSCWGAIIFWSDCICFVHSLSFLTKLSAKFITCCTLIKCLFPNSVIKILFITHDWYEFVHLLRNNNVILKSLRNNYVKVAVTHMEWVMNYE